MMANRLLSSTTRHLSRRLVPRSIAIKSSFSTSSSSDLFDKITFIGTGKMVRKNMDEWDRCFRIEMLHFCNTV